MNDILFSMKQCVKCKNNRDDNLFATKNDGAINKTCSICNEKIKEKHHNRNRDGLCSICGKIKLKNGKKNCQKCRQQASDNQKLKREEDIKNGTCITCHKNIRHLSNTRCKRCIVKYHLPITIKLFRGARTRAKKNSIEFTITENDIIVPEYCPILGCKLQENDFTAKYNSYSLDRIDPSRGYVKGNIQVISHRANQIKNDATIEELKMLLNFMERLPLTDEIK